MTIEYHTKQEYLLVEDVPSALQIDKKNIYKRQKNHFFFFGFDMTLTLSDLDL